MKISHALSLLLAKAGATMATNGNDKPMLKSRIPSTGNEWVSLKDGVEFQPAMDHEDPKVSKAVEQARLRFLSQTSEGESSAYETQFIDGSETYYAVLSQAWRYIGFFVDCNGISRDNRMLEEGNGGDACGRYLLWAAYIDLDYGGGGLGEYQLFNPATGAYDASGCSENNSTNRCVKMDCHESNTNWQLLGYFKELDYREWMEQTFKHMGECIWSYDQTTIMQTDRDIWPEYCSESTTPDEETGEVLYYDMMPLPEGRITIGLYTDNICSTVYTGKYTTEEVLYAMEYGQSAGGIESWESDNDDGANNQYQGNNNGRQLEDGGEDVYTLETGLAEWNEGFDYFKVCQPCMTYTPPYKWGSSSNDDDGGNDNNDNNNGMGKFQCQDVSQCMKFATHTPMTSATYADLELAGLQGSIVQVAMANSKTVVGQGGFATTSPISTGNIVFFAFGLVVLVAGYLYEKSSGKEDSEFQEPMISNNQALA